MGHLPKSFTPYGMHYLHFHDLFHTVNVSLSKENKMSVHTASRVSGVATFVRLGLGLLLVGLGLASQASRVYLRGVPIHTATGVCIASVQRKWRENIVHTTIE